MGGRQETPRARRDETALQLPGKRRRAIRIGQPAPHRGWRRVPVGDPAGPKPGIKGVTLSGRGERAPGTAALKVTTRRAGAAGDGMSSGSAEGGGERTPGAPPSRSLGPWAGTPGRTALRRTPRNPLTFTISRAGAAEDNLQEAPRTPPPTSPGPAEAAVGRGAPNCQDPLRDSPTPVFRPAFPQVTCPIAPAAGGWRPPLTSPGSRNHFPKEKRKGGRGLQGVGGWVRDSGERRELGLGPRRVRSLLAGLSAPRGGEGAPRG